MGIFHDSTVAKYVRTIRNSPKEIIVNRRLLVTAGLFATSGIPISKFALIAQHGRLRSILSVFVAWDQGSSSLVPSLPGFQNAFGLSSGSNPTEIANFISFVYIGAGVGSALSFFINDRVGRLWSMRLYMLIWIAGQLIATFANGSLAALYTARIVSGLGLGPLTVTGPMSIVEIAPQEFRGLLGTWFSVVMLLALTVSCFIVYASFLHVAIGKLQYQVVWFMPCIVIGLVIVLSFFCMNESPRWLMLKDREEEAFRSLIELRGLPADHPRVANEIADIQSGVDDC